MQSASQERNVRRSTFRFENRPDGWLAVGEPSRVTDSLEAFTEPIEKSARQTIIFHRLAQRRALHLLWRMPPILPRLQRLSSYPR